MEGAGEDDGRGRIYCSYCSVGKRKHVETLTWKQASRSKQVAVVVSVRSFVFGQSRH